VNGKEKGGFKKIPHLSDERRDPKGTLSVGEKARCLHLVGEKRGG